MKETISHDAKINRLKNLIDSQRKISREKMNARVGSTDRVFIERISRNSIHEVMGRTFLNHPVVLSGDPELVGSLQKIKITGIKGSTLLASAI